MLCIASATNWTSTRDFASMNPAASAFLAACCGVSERIMFKIPSLGIGDSLELAPENLQIRPMKKDQQKSIILDIFTNISSHRLASSIIRKHSSNPRDIRKVAFDSVDISECREILDIGCGFGYFTESLEGRVQRDAAVTGLDMIPGYRKPYLDTCTRAGLKGRFLADGLSPLHGFEQGSFDLVLCSYALYFFPQIIPEIARVLSGRGHFLAITHSARNMTELVEAVKRILAGSGLARYEKGHLPIETIVSRFCAENGEALLSSGFKKIRRIDYKNSLHFRPEDLPTLIDYFRFKGPFFLSGTDLDKDRVAKLLDAYLRSELKSSEEFVISKDDAIFICSGPVHKP